MEILGPNMHSQTRPEEVECFEGFEGIPVFKRSCQRQAICRVPCDP